MHNGKFIILPCVLAKDKKTIIFRGFYRDGTGISFFAVENMTGQMINIMENFMFGRKFDL